MESEELLFKIDMLKMILIQISECTQCPGCGDLAKECLDSMC